MLGEALLIYTDGSVNANNTGGVGIRIISIDANGDEAIYDAYRAGYRNTNSGQMEIIACTEALEEAGRLQLAALTKHIVILTDSKYVSENYKAAMFDWSKNKWYRKTGRPVQDAYLWKDLIKQITSYNNDHIYIEIKWIKGHDKDEHNIAVDTMSRRASRLPLDKIPKHSSISISQPRKLISSPKMEIGSVEINGQKISIKILSGKLLKPQNIWCYQYQVMTGSSPSFGLVDQIFAERVLDNNKTYYVKFNSEKANPRIEKLYWKIS